MSTLSEAYAQADGIKRVFDPECRAYGRNGHYVYEIPCCKCGAIVRKVIYDQKRDYLCPMCKRGVEKKKRELKILESVPIGLEKENEELSKEERRFLKAVSEINSQVSDMKPYEKAIKIAKTRQDRYGSVPEAMVAIELIRLGYQIIPQQKVGDYRVDFAIPKEKWVIEVDGEVFHSKKSKKTDQREMFIQRSFGYDWNIIHIPAESAKNNIQQLDRAIKKFLDYWGTIDK